MQTWPEHTDMLTYTKDRFAHRRMCTGRRAHTQLQTLTIAHMHTCAHVHTWEQYRHEAAEHLVTEALGSGGDVSLGKVRSAGRK